MASLSPPGSFTNFANSGCYLRRTNNCSEKLSREHYISESVLEQLQGEKVAVTGMPWLPKGETRQYNVSALTSKILCERHNNALSPLDSIAGNAMRQFTAAIDHATRVSKSERQETFIISGDGLERWAIKTLIGLFHAKAASQDGAQLLANSFSYDEAVVVAALSGEELPDRLGLNVAPFTNADALHGYSFAPLLSPDRKILGGIRWITWGVHFDTLIDLRGASSSFIADRSFYRPGVLDLEGPRRTARVYLTWPKIKPNVQRIAIKVEPKCGPST